MKAYYIYLHIFPNGKMYCGITRQEVLKRWLGGAGYRTQRLIGRAIKKYGWKNIQHKIIAKVFSQEEACQLEKETIKKYKLNQKEFGYNIAEGGTCPNMSEESKKLLSEARKGQHNSPNTEFKKGHIPNPKAYEWTPERRLKQSLSHKGRHLSPKTEFTSESMSGKNNTRAYGVYQYTKDLKFVAYYETALEASQKTGISRTGICNCRCGTVKSAGGYRWFATKIEQDG